MRLSIDEYSDRFELPVETIHTQLRNRELDYTIDDGVVYILLSSTPIPTQKTSVGTIIAIYQKENQQLKDRVSVLESKIDKLIDDKEQMLRQERERIEAVYQNKDAQLKSILELVNTKLLLESKESQTQTIVDEEFHEAELSSENEENTTETLTELKHYLKTLDIKSSIRKKIRHTFQEAYGNDVRVIQQNGLFYLDFSKYDYSDLLNY